MKSSSAKQKGRLLQQEVARQLRNAYGLTDNDVFSRSMGACGTDIYFSNAGANLCPFDIECKAQESLNIWAALAQAKENSVAPRVPLVVFKRNRSDIYACLPFEDLLRLLKDSK